MNTVAERSMATQGEKKYQIIQQTTMNDSRFLTNLKKKFFILIHLLHSSTYFEHYCAHLKEHNYINTASGIVTLIG